MKTEIHLFMIWEKGRYMENDIFNDLKQNFKLLDAYHIHWNKDDFNKNLSRFYGQNLPKNCHKHEHVGDGIMSLYIVEDDEPKYDMRQTSKGEEKVNVNVFDKKVLYRNWTGGGHKIHSSNDQKEAKADILLLTGSLYENFISKKWDGEYKYSNELHGNSGWDSVEQIFEILNVRINYVVLRNFECLPNQYYCDKHGDIDLLVDNLDLSVSLLNAEKVFNERYRVHYKIKIGKDQVLFDFRYVGDKYYCTKWEKNILDHKVKYNGINVPDKINHKYSLLYHALIHKPNVSEDYQKKLEKLFYNINLNKLPNILFEYIEKNGFYITDPIDQSVYYNYKYAKEINIQRILYYNLKYNIKIPLNSPVLKNNIENSYENNKKVLTALNADNKRLLLINMGLGLISFSKIITDKLLGIYERNSVNYEIGKVLKRSNDRLEILDIKDGFNLDFQKYEIAIMHVDNFNDFLDLLENINLNSINIDIYLIIRKEIVDYFTDKTNFKFNKLFLCNYSEFGFTCLIHIKDDLVYKDIGMNCPYYIVNITNKREFPKKSIWFSSTDRSTKFRTESIKVENKIYKQGSKLITNEMTFQPQYENIYYPQQTLEEYILKEKSIDDSIRIFKSAYEQIDTIRKIKIQSEGTIIHDYLIDGKLIDAIPKNIIIDKGNLILFDSEWEFNMEIPLSYLIYRSILSLLCNKNYSDNLKVKCPNENNINEQFSRIYHTGCDYIIKRYSNAEQSFQNFVSTGVNEYLKGIKFEYE